MIRACLGLIAVVILLLSPVAFADDGHITEAADAKRKINLAGRQRMLTQRIAKSACLAQLGINSDENRAMISDAMDTFSETLTALRDGSPSVGMRAETDPDVLQELGRVAKLWSGFSATVTPASEGPLSERDFQTLRADNVPLLMQMHKAVAALETAKATQSMSPELARLINVAGKQRMLTQRAVKDACFVLEGTDPVADRSALQATVAEFESSLADLIAGQSERGILPAPTWEIQAQLELVRTLWSEIAPGLHIIAGGQAPTVDTLKGIATKSEEVLFEMNNAVWIYEHL